MSDIERQMAEALNLIERQDQRTQCRIDMMIFDGVAFWRDGRRPTWADGSAMTDEEVAQARRELSAAIGLPGAKLAGEGYTVEPFKGGLPRTNPYIRTSAP